MRFASFFAGIGGFDLGLQKAGMEPVFHCEIDPHCQKILKRHWPKVPLHGDITTLTASQIPEAEIWCAGWPCQDLSQGNAFRAGLQGSRSGLFFTFSKLAEEIKPKWIILENVKGLLTADKGTAFEHVINTLEEIGYLGDGLRATSLILDCHNIENAYSLSPVINPIVHTNSILTAANCLGIIRRERRAGRGGKLDPIFRKSLFQTLRFWFSVGEVSGTPKPTTIAPRYVPKLEDIKAVIQTDQFYVARNLTWNECEKLMGFPEGWTVEEGDSLATPSLQLSSKK